MPSATVAERAALVRTSATLGRAGILATRTLTGLSSYFTEKDHRPSPAMWDALADLAITMEAMADGTAAPKFYLSSLDPGVGKTRTITNFVDALLSQQAYSHVGVMLCVARLSELQNLIHEMAIPSENLAVMTSDATLNALGKASVDQAQVLITTQQMVEKRLNHGAFRNTKQFFYQGQPRAVRIWDESYLPGQTVTLNRDDLSFLLKAMRYSFPNLTGAIEDLFTSLRDVEDGATIQLPNFAEDHKVELNDVLAIFDEGRDNGERKLKDEQRMVISSLWFLSGKAVSIRLDGQMGNTAIDYRDTLPDDLAPMVILDASGRVRDTYRDIEESRGTLVRLKTATKRYDNLTVHLWKTGGGKRAFQTNGEELIAGIARTIDTKPLEKWLVVTHRRDGKVGDIEKGIRSLMTVPPDNVAFITWGKHMATNDFIAIHNVILAGTLFFRPSQYEALKRLAAGRPAAEGAVTKAEVARVMVGEHSHFILQGVCRCAVRRCEDDHCPKCDVYLPASVRSGIPTALPMIFPYCKVVPWAPIARSLKGHVKPAVEMLEAWAVFATEGDTLPFKDVAKALGISNHDFNVNIRRHADFIGAVSESGVVEWGRGVYFTAFRLAA